MERDHLHNRVVCPMQEVDFTNGFFPTPPALYLPLLALGLQLLTSYNNSQRNGKNATKGIDKLRFAFLGRDWSWGNLWTLWKIYNIYITIYNYWKIHENTGVNGWRGGYHIYVISPWLLKCTIQGHAFGARGGIFAILSFLFALSWRDGGINVKWNVATQMAINFFISDHLSNCSKSRHVNPWSIHIRVT